MNKNQLEKLNKDLRKDNLKIIAVFAFLMLLIALFKWPSSTKKIEGIAISQSYLQSGDSQGYTSMKVKLSSGKTIGVVIINHNIFEKGKIVIVNNLH